jgi:hypothetical protein
MKPHLEKLLRDCTFEVSSVEDVDVEKVNSTVDRHSFACVRGLFSKQEMAAACKRVAQNFTSKNDRPAIGDTGRDVMNNYQKLAVGGAMTSWDYRPRFYRIFYTPLWADDIFGVHDIFRRFARLRNRLQGYPPNFAIDTIDEGLWTAARMQHYPAGGGFFMAHRDVVIDTVTHDAGQRRFHQLLLLMTTKGEDFRDGGGFVDIGEDRLMFEEECGAGDVILYNGATIHGVADIDPHVAASLDRMDGRLVALASLYKDMSKDKKPYEGYEDRKAPPLQVA